MQRLTFTFLAIVGGFLFLTLGARADEARPLSLDEYLGQVRQSHRGLQGAQRTSEGAKERSEDASLMLAPQLFANATLSNDAKPTANPSFQGTRTIYDSYSLGVSKLTKFGLQAKISYNVNYTDFVGVDPLFVPVSKFFDAKPMIELTQSLWRNGFGSETRALLDLQEAQALATSFSESFKAKNILFDAESAYWRLVVARETAVVQRASLDRGKKIVEWAQRRVRDDLADRTDLLQAEAAYQVKELELQMALDDERSAIRQFNSLRGSDSEELEVALDKMTTTALDKASAPSRAELRDDVLAAKQMQRVAAANADLIVEKNSPTLDVFGSVALNGRDPQVGSAMDRSFRTSNPTTVVGVRFTAPLDFGLVSENRAAARKEKLGADLAYERKRFEQEREWTDLTRKLGESQRRLELALAIEKAQGQKVTHERGRHERGRTTTFQVLQFEQEYAASQLSRLRTQAEILRLVAQMKTFGGPL